MNETQSNFLDDKTYSLVLVSTIFPILTAFFNKILETFFDIHLVVSFFNYVKSLIYKQHSREVHVKLYDITYGWRDGVKLEIQKSGLSLIYFCNTTSRHKLKRIMLTDIDTDDIQTQQLITKLNNQLFLPTSDMTQLINFVNREEKMKRGDSWTRRNYYQDTDQVEIFEDIFMKTTSEFAENYVSVKAIVSSNKKTIPELYQFFNDIEKSYNESIIIDKRRLMIYKEFTKGMPLFHRLNIDTTQTFDNLFFSQKENILKDIQKISDVEYHKKYGLKRKLSYMFSGSPGTGKTCVATAIANYLNRTIVYIPISRITENKQIEKILYDNNCYGCFGGKPSETKDEISFNCDSINDIDYNKYVFFFDEIDSIGTKFVKKENESDDEDEDTKKNVVIVNTGDKESKPITTPEQKDKFEIGLFLNILDGNSNQDGMIIIATANNLSKLDPAIYRDGRMKHIVFAYLGRREIVEMLEKYSETELTNEQKQRIRDDKKIVTLTLKNFYISNIHLNIDDLINKINEL